MTIGWYIHHHGSGHLHRFLAVAPCLSGVTVLSSLPRPRDAPVVDWIELPLDVPVDESARAGAGAGGRLHFAPVGAEGYQRRMATIAEWIARATPAAFVVDVSVEVALLARLVGSRVVWVAQRGERTDPPHRLAYDIADSIIVPWTADVLSPGQLGGPPAARSKFVGALSRFDARRPPGSGGSRHIVLLLGSGGHAVTAQHVAAAAAATPDWTWEVAGLLDPPCAPNVVVHAPDDDVWALLGRATVVVASASGNAVAEVAAARRPLVCLPQPRPFDEQSDQARALARAGLALHETTWPEPERWPGVLARAQQLDPDRWDVLHDGGGPRRFARAVRQVACA